MTTVVYTDGACSGNPGPGGWAWAVPDGPFCAGHERHTTNQRMEVKAALEALTHFQGPVEVVSDSTYVVNCFRDRWWEGWVSRGWLTSQKKPVANRDLWEPLIELVRSRSEEISFRWVKGHSGDLMNDIVDRLAVQAAQTQRDLSGDRPSELNVVGAGKAAPASTNREGTDQKERPAATQNRGGTQDAPPGHLLLVAGEKPPALGGYGETAATVSVRNKLGEIIAAKAAMFPDLVVVSGLGLGVEQLGAEAAVAAGVPFVAILAFPGQEKVWFADASERYRNLLGKATGEILLQPVKPSTRQEAGAALAKRDEWLAFHVHEAVVVWGGADEFVGRQVRALEEHLGEDEVWILAPA